MIARKQRIFGLDVVRAAAILLILCSHSTILLFPESQNTFIKAIQFLGTIGVDIFFVLSGFLIGTILIKRIENGQTTIKDFGYFWARRWFRTLPNYFLILVINIVLYYTLNNQLPERLGSYFLFLQNFNTVQPDFFTESWSLSIEEFAYILGPIILLMLSFVFKKLNRITFLVMTLLIIILFTINRFIFHFDNVNFTEEATWSKVFRKVVLYRIDSIYYGFIGAYIAYYFKAVWFRFRKQSFILGSILFLLIHIYIIKAGIEPSVSYLFFNGFYLALVSISILLLFPVFSTWKTGNIFSKTITKISIWSYAIYLINYSIILLTIKHFIDVDNLHLIEKLLVLAIFWGITFLLSSLLYSQFEKPVMQIRDAKKVKRFFTPK